MGRCDSIAQAPACHAVGLGETVDGDGALPHPGDSRHADVFAPVDQVFVYLVGNSQSVPPLAESRDELELLAREDLPGRIVGRIDDDGLGPGSEGGGQLIGVESPCVLPARQVWLVKGNVPGDGAGQQAVRPIVLVEGLEDHHLIARVHHGHDGSHHGLGSAAAYGYLGLGVHLQPLETCHLARDGGPESRCAPRYGVLVQVLLDGATGGILDGLGRREVGKSLGQVHPPVSMMGQKDSRHLSDDRFSELERSFGHWCTHTALANTGGGASILREQGK